MSALKISRTAGIYIDAHFEHQRREDVIQYICRKYSRTRAALAATVTSYRPRSAIRDSGKALGIDPVIVDWVAKEHHWFDSSADLKRWFAQIQGDVPTSGWDSTIGATAVWRQCGWACPRRVARARKRRGASKPRRARPR